MRGRRPRALDVQTVASRLGVSEWTVRRLIQGKKLRAFRPGRQWRVFEHDLDAFIRRQTQDASDD